MLAESIVERLKNTSIPDRYSKNEVAMAMIKEEIKNMISEIEQSEKGSRAVVSVADQERGRGNTKTFKVAQKSTFPEYLQHIFSGSGTKQKFLRAAKRGKGKVWERIALEAISRLENGYKNQHGYDYPRRDFIEVVKNPVPF